MPCLSQAQTKFKHHVGKGNRSLRRQCEPCTSMCAALAQSRPNLVLMSNIFQVLSRSLSRSMAKYVHLQSGTVQVVVCLAMLGISIGSWDHSVC